MLRVLRSVSRFILHVDVWLFQHHLLKRIIFLHSISFAPLSKISWSYLCLTSLVFKNKGFKNKSIYKKQIGMIEVFCFFFFIFTAMHGSRPHCFQAKWNNHSATKLCCILYFHKDSYRVELIVDQNEMIYPKLHQNDIYGNI